MGSPAPLSMRPQRALRGADAPEVLPEQPSAFDRIANYTDQQMLDLGLLDPATYRGRRLTDDGAPTVSAPAARSWAQRVQDGFADARGVGGQGETAYLARRFEDLMNLDDGYMALRFPGLSAEEREQRRDAELVRAVEEARGLTQMREEADPAWREDGGLLGNVGRFTGGLLGDLAGNVNPTYLVGFGGGPVARMAVQGAVNAGIDAGIQAGELGEGVQEEFDLKRTGIQFIAGVALQGAGELVGPLARTARTGYERAVAAGWDRLPEALQQRWAGDLPLVDTPEYDILVADTAEALVGRENMAEHEIAGLAVLRREAELELASPFVRNGAGADMHPQLLGAALQRLIEANPVTRPSPAQAAAAGRSVRARLRSSTAPVAGPRRRLHDGMSAVGLLRQFEGFRGTTYWDVNHYRVGYGSDTITTATGQVRTVREGDTVTRADAERDLARRTAAIERTAAGKAGDGWNQLPAGARAAIVSVTYNYGEGASRLGPLWEAARRGDAEEVARVIASFAEDNGGVNRNRRLEEAAFARGGPMPRAGAGPEVRGEISEVEALQAEIDAITARLDTLGGERSADGAEMSVTGYVDGYIEGRWRERTPPEVEQFAANNAPEIEAEFRRRAEETASAPPDPLPRLRTVAEDRTRSLNDVEGLAEELGLGVEDVRRGLTTLALNGEIAMKIPRSARKRVKSGNGKRRWQSNEEVVADRGGVWDGTFMRSPPAPAKGERTLLERIADMGGIEDRGGDLRAMGGDDWHRTAPFRRRLIRAHDDGAQGAMLGGGMASRNSPEAVFEALIADGYFPELLGRLDGAEAVDMAAEKPDLATLYAAIAEELQGKPVRSVDYDRAAQPAERGPAPGGEEWEWLRGDTETLLRDELGLDGELDAEMLDELVSARLAAFEDGLTDETEALYYALNLMAERNQADAFARNPEVDYDPIDYEPAFVRSAAEIEDLPTAEDLAGRYAGPADPQAGGVRGGPDGEAGGSQAGQALAELAPEARSPYLDPDGDAAKAQAESLAHDARAMAEAMQRLEEVLPYGKESVVEVAAPGGKLRRGRWSKVKRIVLEELSRLGRYDEFYDAVMAMPNAWARFGEVEVRAGQPEALDLARGMDWEAAQDFVLARDPDRLGDKALRPTDAGFYPEAKPSPATLTTEADEDAMFAALRALPDDEATEDLLAATRSRLWQETEEAGGSLDEVIGRFDAARERWEEQFTETRATEKAERLAGEKAERAALAEGIASRIAAGGRAIVPVASGRAPSLENDWQVRVRGGSLEYRMNGNKDEWLGVTPDQLNSLASQLGVRADAAPALDRGAEVDPAIAERQRQEAALGAEAPLRTLAPQESTLGLGLFGAADGVRLDAEGEARPIADLLDEFDAEAAELKTIRDCL